MAAPDRGRSPFGAAGPGTVNGMRKGVKVRRVLRRVELWPVAKVAFFFHLFCYVLTLGALVGCWFAADRLGTLQNVEKLATRLGWEEFTIHGDVLFRSAALIGGSLVGVATVVTVAMAFFYNMLSGLFGGLVVSVLQEHVPEGGPLTRRQRRAASRAAKKQLRRTSKRGRGRRKARQMDRVNRQLNGVSPVPTGEQSLAQSPSKWSQANSGGDAAAANSADATLHSAASVDGFASQAGAPDDIDDESPQGLWADVSDSPVRPDSEQEDRSSRVRF